MRNLWKSLAGVLLGFAGLGQPGQARATTSDLIVHVYDIGQGSCVLIECPGDLPILVDCGKMKVGGGSIQAAGRKINEVLDGYSDYYQPLRVILSHGDLDHYSLLGTRNDQGRFLLDPGKVRDVYFGGAFADYGSARGWMDEVHRSLSSPRRPYPVTRPCNTAARISCLRPNEVAWGSIRRMSCGAAKVDLLTVNAQAYYRGHPEEFVGTDWLSDGRKNGDSAVVRVSYGGVSFLLTGDAQEMTERLIQRNAQAAGVSLARTGFLFGSHHGARTHGSNGEDWIKATSPRLAVFSSNFGGGHGHPTCEVVTRVDVADDLDMADAPDGGMAVRCDKETSPRTFKNKILVTEATGDITVTVPANGAAMIACSKVTKACAW